VDALYEGKKLKERVRDSLLGKSQAKILIIEDEVDYQQYLNALLSPTHEVLMANNAVDGISLAATTPDLDLVLLDIRMPYMDGTEAVFLLRKKCPDARIIMLTASDDTDNIIRSLRDGAYDYCIKPIIPEQLLSRVGQCLEEKFYPKVMDEMIKEIHVKHVSDQRRISLLEELCFKRKAEGKLISVQEILVFFPQLKTESMSKTTSLHPDALLAVGIPSFIYSLKQSVL
jgi:CheY-like chemotaxis protein